MERLYRKILANKAEPVLKNTKQTRERKKERERALLCFGENGRTLEVLMQEAPNFKFIWNMSIVKEDCLQVNDMKNLI